MCNGSKSLEGTEGDTCSCSRRYSDARARMCSSDTSDEPRAPSNTGVSCHRCTCRRPRAYGPLSYPRLRSCNWDTSTSKRDCRLVLLALERPSYRYSWGTWKMRRGCSGREVIQSSWCLCRLLFSLPRRSWLQCSCNGCTSGSQRADICLSGGHLVGLVQVWSLRTSRCQRLLTCLS